MPMVAPYSEPCCDCGAVGERQRRHARPVELDELPDDTFGSQHLRDGEDEVGRRGTLSEPSAQPESHDLRISIETGCPSIAASASIRPRPSNNAEPVDHRGM